MRHAVKQSELHINQLIFGADTIKEIWLYQISQPLIGPMWYYKEFAGEQHAEKGEARELHTNLYAAGV